MISSHWIMVF
jgi:hypothetical protein